MIAALIDYGSGNLRSAQKALLKVGANVRVVRRPEEMADADAVVLPGVGAFDDCVNALQKQGLLEGVRKFIQTGRPFLGICVGYQALFEKSEEFNSCAAGLGIFQGNVVRFREKPGLRQNPKSAGTQNEFNNNRIARSFGGFQAAVTFTSSTVFSRSQSISPSSRAGPHHFTESPFASAIWRDNVFATQFHPEKSQKVGLQLLKNFVE